MKIRAVITVKVRPRNDIQHDLPLGVVPGGGPSFIGQELAGPGQPGLRGVH